MSPATPHRTTRSARTARAVLVALTLLLGSSALTSCQLPNSAQQEVMDHINNSRYVRGIPRLAWNEQLQQKAQAWAEHLANKGSLQHSRLADGITYSWRKLGENVGYGGNIRQIHLAYMNSPGHRANILDRAFTHVGTGVATRGTRTYTVQVFMRL